MLVTVTIIDADNNTVLKYIIYENYLNKYTILDPYFHKGYGLVETVENYNFGFHVIYKLSRDPEKVPEDREIGFRSNYGIIINIDTGEKLGATKLGSIIKKGIFNRTIIKVLNKGYQPMEQIEYFEPTYGILYKVCKKEA